MASRPFRQDGLPHQERATFHVGGGGCCAGPGSGGGRGDGLDGEEAGTQREGGGRCVAWTYPWARTVNAAILPKSPESLSGRMTLS